jgi:hypothetical protein
MHGRSELREQDLRRLLDVVSPAALSTHGPEIPEQVLIGLADLIPCARPTTLIQMPSSLTPTGNVPSAAIPSASVIIPR